MSEVYALLEFLKAMGEVQGNWWMMAGKMLINLSSVSSNKFPLLLIILLKFYILVFKQLKTTWRNLKN